MNTKLNDAIANYFYNTEAINEDKDENFVIAKITNQDKAKIIPK